MFFQPDSASIVYLPVYVSHLSPILQLMTELVSRDERARQKEATPPDPDAGGSAGGSAGASLWSPANLAELHRRCKPLQRAVVTRVATAAVQGTAATYEELRVAMQEITTRAITYNHLSASLAWISKFSVKIIGVPQGPFESTTHVDVQEKGTRFTFPMSKTDANVWLAIVANAGATRTR